MISLNMAWARILIMWRSWPCPTSSYNSCPCSEGGLGVTETLYLLLFSVCCVDSLSCLYFSSSPVSLIREAEPGPCKLLVLVLLQFQ